MKRLIILCFALLALRTLAQTCPVNVSVATSPVYKITVAPLTPNAVTPITVTVSSAQNVAVTINPNVLGPAMDPRLPAPGTSGNVCTSDGSKWISAAPTSGGITGPTDSTLTQTGTTLGLNLANANTWTVGQAINSDDGLTCQSRSNSDNVSEVTPAFLFVLNGGARSWLKGDRLSFNNGQYYTDLLPTWGGDTYSGVYLPSHSGTLALTSDVIPHVTPGTSGNVLTSDGSNWTSTTPSVAWGNVTGTLSNQTDLATALAAKEPSIAPGTASQYWRGDKTWQPINWLTSESDPVFTAWKATTPPLYTESDTLATVTARGAATSVASSFTGGLSVSAVSAGSLNVLAPTTSTVGAIIKGAAGQTADLQQWQDSTGAVRTSISAIGDVIVHGTGSHPGGDGPLKIVDANNKTIFAVGDYTGATEGVIYLWAPAGQGYGSGITFYSAGGTKIGLFQLDGAGNMVFRNSNAAGTFFDFNTSGLFFRDHTYTKVMTLSEAGNLNFGSAGDVGFLRSATGVMKVTDGGSGDGTITAKSFRLKGYTVATLPAGTQGDTAYVTDAVAPTYLGPLVGGGAVVTPVFYNGTAWVAY
jgi:hypothetical protein